VNKYGLGARKKSWALWGYALFFLGVVLCSLSVVTQATAQAALYHPALGKPFYRLYYWPWQVLVWWYTLPSSHPYISPQIVKGQMTFVLPQVAVIGFWLLFVVKPRGKDDLHGSARWAGEKDVKAAGLFDGKGVYVGAFDCAGQRRYLRHNGPEHLMAFAPTRSGKGVGLVLPTLLSWPESTIVLDIKGENWALTSGWRKKEGQNVFKFDPTDISGTSARFNPLEEIRIDGPRAIPDTQNVANMIVDSRGKGLKDYWNKAAFSFLGGALLHCLVMTRQRHGRCATLHDLSLMMADPDCYMSQLFDEMIETDHVAILQGLFSMNEEDAVAIREFVQSAAREMQNKAANELSGVVSTAVSNLALYRDPVVAKATAHSDFSIHDLMFHEKPVSLYLVVRPSDIDRLQPLIRLIINTILRKLTEDMQFADGRSVAGYKHRLLLMLDEFTSLGRLEIFERALAFMAGYGIKSYIIVQDLAQLQAAYGKEESIMSNCHLRMAFAPNKLETAKVLSGMTGQTTVVHKRTSISGNRAGHLGRANVSIQETARPLLTPDECMRLPGAIKDSRGRIKGAGDMLIFPAGFPPILGKQILYFQDPTFGKRARISAPEGSDCLTPQTSQAPQIHRTPQADVSVSQTPLEDDISRKFSEELRKQTRPDEGSDETH
jgi:type IV secretion system protein VirD4